MIERLRLYLIKKSHPERYRLLQFMEAAAEGKVPKNVEPGGVSLVFIGRPGVEGTDHYINYIRRANEENDIDTFFLLARGSEDLRRAEVISQTLCSQNDFVEIDRAITQPRRATQEFVPVGIICLRKTDS